MNKEEYNSQSYFTVGGYFLSAKKQATFQNRKGNLFTKRPHA